MIAPSAYAETVELRHRAGVRMSVPGAMMSEGGGRDDALKKVIPDLHNADIWVGVAADAVVVKYAMSGTLPNGEAFASPHCMVMHVRDGQIHMVDIVSDTVTDGAIVAAVFSEPGQNLDPTTEEGIELISSGPGAADAKVVVAQRRPTPSMSSPTRSTGGASAAAASRSRCVTAPTPASISGPRSSPPTRPGRSTSAAASTPPTRRCATAATQPWPRVDERLADVGSPDPSA